MKLFWTVFKAYTYRDKVLSAFAIVVLLLMVVKMMLFPYGLFGFGSDEIYTEGIVAKNGIQNLNPLFTDYNEADREVSRLIFSGLMKYDPVNKAIVDDVGTLTISGDKKEYSFKIREGVRFHDGDFLTADDVYFTFAAVVQNPAFQNEVLRTNFEGVDIQLIDEMTIKFILPRPNIFFISNLTTGILPEHILGDIEPDRILEADFNKKPIGSGPYMVNDPVSSFSSGRMQITLERNPYYYEKPSEIEFIRFVAFPSIEKLVEDVNSVNAVVKVTGEYFDFFEQNERFELIPYELPQYLAVYFNMDSPILKDQQKVRLALQKAVDKEELIAGRKDLIRVDTPLLELDQKDWLYQSSKEQAQGALKDAGYNYQAEDVDKVGVRYNEEDEALELKLLARAYDEGTPQFTETLGVVDFLQNSWEEIGFSIQVEFLPLQQFNEAVMSRQYDLLLVGQNLGYNLDTYSYWHSTQATPLGQNFSNYRSFQADALIENVRTIFDPAVREEKLLALANSLRDDVPAVFLYRPVYYYAIDSKVTGVALDSLVFPSDRFFRVGEWRFK